jgi:hypothetical protein
MKRHILAIALGSLFALPAFANGDPAFSANEIDAGNLPQAVVSVKSSEQVRDELVAAQAAGQVIVNAELGTLAVQPAPLAGKSVAQVRNELIAAQRSGDVVANGETGLTAREVYPAQYAGVTAGQARIAAK